MPAAISPSDPQQADASAADSADALWRLHEAARDPHASDATLLDLLRRLTRLLQHPDAPAQLRPVAVCYLACDDGEDSALPVRLDSDGQATPDARRTRQLARACTAACRSGQPEIWRQISPAQAVVAVPVPQLRGAPGALAVAFAGEEVTAPQRLLVQQMASCATTWQIQRLGPGGQSQPDERVLLDLLTRLGAAQTLHDASFDLVAQLAAALDCQRVAVGVCREGGRCRLKALSGVAHVDTRSENVRAIEAVLEEIRVHASGCCWPARQPAGGGESDSLALKHLCITSGTAAAVAMPLRLPSGDSSGAVLVWCESQADAAQAERFLSSASLPLAVLLDLLQKKEGSRLTRLGRRALRQTRCWRGRVAIAAALLVILMLFIPVPHNVSCDCRIEPVTRRFVAAPFEGTLQQSLVSPGDLVRAGETLARMEGREVRWERAGVVADLQRALKKRDAAQASHDYGEQRIAELEAERLELQLQLLDHHSEHLDVKCPIDGIVTSGDLERAEGAPLTIGQTLFEIAPLDKMIVELAVPDRDVALLERGQPLRVRLDAYADRSFDLRLADVHPRSEIRDESNVFIAEAHIDNADGRLRPGMEGRAKVQTGTRPLLWVLFHRPWEALTKRLFW